MKNPIRHADVAIVGAGINGATFATLLLQRDPTLTIEVFERMPHVASESSDAWNNAGTGHAGLCELNYTPMVGDIVETHKAATIGKQFQESLNFWNDLGIKSAVKNVPHISVVFGSWAANFLKKRHEALSKLENFRDLEFTQDRKTLTEWMPLIMDGRSKDQIVTATRSHSGTDVDFGAITRALFERIDKNIKLHLNHDVRHLTRVSLGNRPDKNGWRIGVRDLATNEGYSITASKVFIAAGGGSLQLLEKSGVKEGNGYGGFSVSGMMLMCTNQDIVDQHDAKAYGLAAAGAPPFSMPHLDTRWINGKKYLFFGPYAGFSLKFLKNGSNLDLPASITAGNVGNMLAAGIHNAKLTKYLMEQVLLSKEERLTILREYYPKANLNEWELHEMAIRVQILKGKDIGFGTELIVSEDKSIAALLGASPGASTSVSIMRDLVSKFYNNFAIIVS